MTVSFSNIPSNLRVPLFYVEVDNSMANSATETQRTLLIGQMTAEGTATAGDGIPLFVGLHGCRAVRGRLHAAYHADGLP